MESSNNSSTAKSINQPSDKSKWRIYRLRDVSYMSLSMSYIFLLIFLFVLIIGICAYSLLTSNIWQLLLWLPLCFGLLFFVYNTGIKYGEYGLEILIAKAFMKKRFKNDFPVLRNQLLNRNLLTSELEELPILNSIDHQKKKNS